MVSARPSQLRKCRQYRGSGGDAGHLFHDNDTKNICHPYVRKTNLSILRFPFAISEAVRPAATVRRDARRDSPTSWPSPAIRRRRISHAAGPCSGRSRGRRLRSVRVRTAESSCASRRCLRGAVPSRFPASRAEPGKNRTVWSSPVSADPDTGTIRFQIAIVRFLRNSTRRTGERRNYFFVERRNLRFFPV